MTLVIKECPKCGRIVNPPSDKRERKARLNQEEIRNEEADEKCGRCETGAENREKRL